MRMAIFAALVVLAAGPPAASAPLLPSTKIGAPDPFAWLEDVRGARAMAWVKAQDARTAKVLETDPRYELFRKEALAIFTSPERIPEPEFLGEDIANFWQDR
ncbi:MAG: S9 family peptidase, partial [Caulobacteraceae bacterium]